MLGRGAEDAELKVGVAGEQPLQWLPDRVEESAVGGTADPAEPYLRCIPRDGVAPRLEGVEPDAIRHDLYARVVLANVIRDERVLADDAVRGHEHLLETVESDAAVI